MAPSAAGIVVRPIEFRDIPGFREAVGAVAAERRWLARTSMFSMEQTAVFVAGNIAHAHPQFVADDGGRVVGWCDVFPVPREVSPHVGVLGMGVLRDYRGRGIGRRLIAAALAAAEGRFEQVDLDVYGNNVAAQALYRSVGFVEQGRKRGGRKLDGAYDDILLMTRFLKEPT
ncbi:MAG TPA: GNAT family N-acetyltransferase [Casimicrobiaceae bacterium]|nr:GNAT family N-acetyltransferase [Casimicrobiaceae bacterium]